MDFSIGLVNGLPHLKVCQLMGHPWKSESPVVHHCFQLSIWAVSSIQSGWKAFQSHSPLGLVMPCSQIISFCQYSGSESQVQFVSGLHGKLILMAIFFLVVNILDSEYT